jgi:Double zinc ribbon
MKCPRCQQENPPQAKFCLECGVPIDGATASPKWYADPQGENEGLRRSLGEAHAQVSEASARATATSDILRVISSSRPATAQQVSRTTCWRPIWSEPSQHARAVPAENRLSASPP